MNTCKSYPKCLVINNCECYERKVLAQHKNVKVSIKKKIPKVSIQFFKNLFNIK